MTERKYLYEASGGKSGHVVADSVADARTRLAGEGYRDVVVHDDDFLSDLREAGEKQSGIPQPADLEVLLRHDPSALGLTRYVLRKNWITLLLTAGVVYFLLSSGTSWWLLTVVLAIMGYLLYAMLFPGWLQWQQNEMHRKFWAGDWDAAGQIARRLRGLKLVRKLPAACMEFDARIGACLVMKGDAAAGYAMLAPWEAQPGLAPGTWRVKTNMLHFLARDWARAVEGQERILEETANDTARIDLALMLARLGDDDARAGELLDSIDPQRVVPMQAAFIAWARGVLLAKRGENEAALGELTAAAAGMQELAINPLAWGSLALCTGYLAVAMARTGRRDAARAMLASVRSIVERHGEDLLLEWLRSEGLLEPRTSYLVPHA